MTPPELPREVVDAIEEYAIARHRVTQEAGDICPATTAQSHALIRAYDALCIAITGALTAARESACPHVVASGESRYCTLAERSDSNARVRALIAELRMDHDADCWIGRAQRAGRDTSTVEDCCTCGAYVWNEPLGELAGRLNDTTTREG